MASAPAPPTCELASRDEAWQELTRVCGDLVSAHRRNLKPNSEWSMELLDGTDATLFRIRLVAETLALAFVLAYLAPLLGEAVFLI